MEQVLSSQPGIALASEIECDSRLLQDHVQRQFFFGTLVDEGHLAKFRRSDQGNKSHQKMEDALRSSYIVAYSALELEVECRTGSSTHSEAD